MPSSGTTLTGQKDVAVGIKLGWWFSAATVIAIGINVESSFRLQWTQVEHCAQASDALLLTDSGDTVLNVIIMD